MFTVVLMQKADNIVLRKVYVEDNDYLSKEAESDCIDYPLLSEVSTVDICVFGSDEMNKLIEELVKIKETNSKQNFLHIDDVIELAKVCERNNEYVLAFTPFSTFLDGKEVETLVSKMERPD